MAQRDKFDLILAQFRPALANLGTMPPRITSLFSAEGGDR
jgi:hypothetical protein